VYLLAAIGAHLLSYLHKPSIIRNSSPPVTVTDGE
jgi:hypothetical protein